MNERSTNSKSTAEAKLLRGDNLRKRIADRNIRVSDFAKRCNFGRNLMYRLCKGQAPTPEQERTIEVVLKAG